MPPDELVELVVDGRDLTVECVSVVALKEPHRLQHVRTLDLAAFDVGTIAEERA